MFPSRSRSIRTAARVVVVGLSLVPALAFAQEGFDGAGNLFESLYSTFTDNDLEVVTLAAVIGILAVLFTQVWKLFFIALIGGAALASIDSIVSWFMGLLS